MAWGITRGLIGSAMVLAMVACDAEVSPREGDDGFIPNSEVNGVLLNSFRLNSFRLNSFRLNSFRLNGDQGTGDFIQMTEVDLPGKAGVAHSWVEGSELHFATTSDKVLSGDDVEGTRLRFVVRENDAENVREILIAGVDIEGSKGDPHWGSWGKWDKHDKHDKHDKQTDEDALVLYDFRIRELPGGEWTSLCGTDADGESIPAVLLTDIWDPETGAKIVPAPGDAVTLACVDAALGKCATWGYHPWAEQDGQPLADHHQACTRLVRADYCGDGVSYTDEGTPIHVLDLLGIEVADLLTEYLVEAEWGPEGAVCLNPGNTRLTDAAVTCGAELPKCGEDFASGGLLQSGKITGEFD